MYTGGTEHYGDEIYFCQIRKSNPDSLIVQPVAYSVYWVISVQVDHNMKTHYFTEIFSYSNEGRFYIPSYV
jgi:hypothetical protein